MQKRLNLMKIMQVVRGTLASGWFEMTLDEFLNTPVEDYGDRIEICYEDGSIFRVMGFDGETVNLRKVASGGAS